MYQKLLSQPKCLIASGPNLTDDTGKTKKIPFMTAIQAYVMLDFHVSFPLHIPENVSCNS